MGETVGNILSGAAKGAAMGSVVPGIGTVIGGAAGAALAVAPEVGKWLFGETGKQVAEQVAATVEAVTGTPDPEMQAAALADPEKATELRVKLLAIAAEREAARDAHLLAMVKVDAADRDAARKADAERTGVLRFATLYFSTAVFVLYAAVLAMGMFAYPAVPPDDMATLRTVFVAAVFYWVGSSRGSAAKDEKKPGASA